MRVIKFLKKSKVKYEVTKHKPAFSAQEMAAVEHDDHITFQAGTHEKAIRMSMDDYRKLVNPQVLEFSYHVTS